MNNEIFNVNEGLPFSDADEMNANEKSNKNGNGQDFDQRGMFEIIVFL